VNQKLRNRDPERERKRSRPSWLPHELATAGQEHLDPSFVESYDRKQGYPKAADDVAVFSHHGLGPDSTILDLGAGTGQFALPAARQFGRVIAVDVSPLMAQVIRERAAADGLRNIEVVQAGFLSYEHQGPTVDGVFTRNALHHLPDFWKAIALERIASVLRPGGILRIHDLIYDFAPSEATAEFDQWFDEAVDDPALGYTAADFAEHIRSEFSTFRWLFEPILAAVGFDILSADFSRSVYGAYTCMRQ
jgi:SAM-dependent methyltransferase